MKKAKSLSKTILKTYQTNTLMKLIEQLRLLERLDQLIRLKATGTPAQLASRIEVSERKLYRLIQSLKEMGFPIEYCKDCQCYQYTEAVKLRVEIQIAEEAMVKIKGGKTLTSFLEPLPNFGRG